MRVLAAALVGTALLTAQAPSLESVLARAGRAADAMHRDTGWLVADEACTLDFAVGSRRETWSMRSEIAMAPDAARGTWTLFRDLLEVNGKALSSDAPGRLERALPRDPGQDATEARRIDDQTSLALMLGPDAASRAPTFALLALLPEQQGRFEFSKKSEKRERGVLAWVVAFRETRGPMFFRASDGRDIPMSGEFWIDPASGAVLRAGYVADSADAKPADRDLPWPGASPQAANPLFARVSAETRFQRDPASGASVPVDMRETYSRDAMIGGASVPALGVVPGATHAVRERLSLIVKYSRVRRAAGQPPAPAR